MAVSSDQIEKTCNIKIEDKENKMHRLKNLIVFESELSKELYDLAKKANINLYKF